MVLVTYCSTHLNWVDLGGTKEEERVVLLYLVCRVHTRFHPFVFVFRLP